MSVYSKSKSFFLKITYLSLFSIALGYLEAAVVTYLRMQFYPHGFYFPLNNAVPDNVLLIEILRELSTIAILLLVAILSGKKFIERFGNFLFILGTWDIFYYIFLKITLGWPSSFFNKDILFLIPFPWISPVLAPIIVSVTLIILSTFIYNKCNKDPSFSNLGKLEWIFFSLSSFFIFCSFVSESLFNQFKYLGLKIVIPSYSSDMLLWIIFVVGELLLILVITLLSRIKKQ